MIRTFILSLMIFAFALSGRAVAADAFTVAAVAVDATADTAIDAQLKATEAGQILAAQRLIERLTLPSERMERGLPEVTIDVARSMIRGQSIGNERRSARRYLGEITVAFNPTRVQSFLRDNGLTMIATQSRNSLVLPVLNGSSPWDDNDWTQAWRDGGYAHALTPITAAPLGALTDGLVSVGQIRAGDKAALARTARQFNVDQILIAEASGAPGNIIVRLSDFAVDSGQTRNLGSVTAGSFRAAATQAITGLENNWKEASVSLAANAEDIAVSVLYNSLDDWMMLQSVINDSAQIQDARLDALSKDGAMMTLTYGGDMARLATELSYKGVQIKTDPKIGTYLARSGYSR